MIFPKIPMNDFENYKNSQNSDSQNFPGWYLQNSRDDFPKNSWGDFPKNSWDDFPKISRDDFHKNYKEWLRKFQKFPKKIKFQKIPWMIFPIIPGMVFAKNSRNDFPKNFHEWLWKLQIFSKFRFPKFPKISVPKKLGPKPPPLLTSPPRSL